MAITRADFFRLIGIALGTDAYRSDADGITLEDGARRLRIDLGAEQRRRIALLEIAHMPVTLSMEGYSEAEAGALLVRFDRAFQRGGG